MMLLLRGCPDESDYSGLFSRLVVKVFKLKQTDLMTLNVYLKMITDVNNRLNRTLLLVRLMTEAGLCVSVSVFAYHKEIPPASGSPPPPHVSLCCHGYHASPHRCSPLFELKKSRVYSELISSEVLVKKPSV